MKPVLKAFTELSQQELYRILAIRNEVFVVEQACAYQDLDDKDQQSKHLFYTTEQSEIVAYARLLPPGLSFDVVSIGRILVAHSHRKHNLGRKLVSDAIAACGTLWPGYGIRIAAQSYLLNFYASFGFEKVGDEYLEDGIPHVDMHLNRINE